MEPTQMIPKEPVKDYPLPPAVDRVRRHVRVVFNGSTVAESNEAIRVLEKGHAPLYFVPPSGVRQELLAASDHQTTSEYLGEGRYFHVRAGGRITKDAAWSFTEPADGYEELRDWMAFNPERVHDCYVDGEKVRPEQAHAGGWITSDVLDVGQEHDGGPPS